MARAEPVDTPCNYGGGGLGLRLTSFSQTLPNDETISYPDNSVQMQMFQQNHPHLYRWLMRHPNWSEQSRSLVRR